MPSSVVNAPGLQPAAESIGVELERRRLEHRARRVERVIVELRARADARDSIGTSPVPLRSTIAGFSRELAHVRQRLAGL